MAEPLEPQSFWMEWFWERCKGTPNFAYTTVNPGDHAIELRRIASTRKILHKRFAAGSAVSLNAADVAMEAAMGQLKILFSPADAVVTLVKDGESSISVSNGTPVVVAPGSYLLTARVGNFPRSALLEVVAGEHTIGPLFSLPAECRISPIPRAGRPIKAGLCIAVEASS